jgi:hypothetical protein
MSAKRYAHAIMSRPGVDFDDWMETLRNQNEGAVPKDHVHRIAKTVLRKCDPKQYLLSHATIVASCDTYAPQNVKTGRGMIQGVQIDVRWPDFRIKPECHEIINNNGDAWERSLLLSTYRTFIGAHNYLEHIQLPELSKGFIVDAIARDLGKSAYIDILVATDRKHKPLVTDILSGEIKAMSMGCISLFTVCTRCGNVASDDAQLCPCVLYIGKGNKFADEQGVEHPVAELIGHVSVPNSNQFIEASWVRNPAFRGAVRRNILNPGSDQIAARIEEAQKVYEIRTDVPLPNGIKKAASFRIAQMDDQGQSGKDQGGGQDQGGQDDADAGGTQQSDMFDSGDAAGGDSDQGGGQSQGQGDKPEAKPSKPEGPKTDSIDKMLDKVQEQLLQIMVEKLGDKLEPKPEDVAAVSVAPPYLPGGNDNIVRSSDDFDRRVKAMFGNTPMLVRWASRNYRIVHDGGRKAIRAAKLTPKDLIILSWIEDRIRGRNYSSRLYKTALRIGPMANFPSETSFLAACKIKLGRGLTTGEENFLMWKGRIASVANF